MLAEIFEKPKSLLAFVKLLPLPGSLGFTSPETVISRAEQEAAALASGGVQGLILENSYDRYTTPRLEPAAAVLMGLIARRIQQMTQLPLGISILPNDPQTALAIALSVKPAFIRVPVPIGVKIGEQGVLESRLAAVLDDIKRLNLSRPIPLVVDLSQELLLPDLLTRQNDSIATSKMSTLLALANRLQEEPAVQALLLTDRDVTPDELSALHQAVRLPCWLFHQGATGAPDQSGQSQNVQLQHEAQLTDYFRAADVLVLEAGIRKHAPSLQLNLSVDWPKVDLTRVEEQVNRLLDVKSIQQLSPDFFVG